MRRNATLDTTAAQWSTTEDIDYVSGRCHLPRQATTSGNRHRRGMVAALLLPPPVRWCTARPIHSDAAGNHPTTGTKSTPARAQKCQLMLLGCALLQTLRGEALAPSQRQPGLRSANSCCWDVLFCRPYEGRHLHQVNASQGSGVPTHAAGMCSSADPTRGGTCTKSTPARAQECQLMLLGCSLLQTLRRESLAPIPDIPCHLRLPDTSFQHKQGDRHVAVDLLQPRETVHMLTHQIISKSHAEIWVQTYPLIKEIVETKSADTREELERLYRKLVIATVLGSGLGYPTNTGVLKEATAALQSAFPLTELNQFLSFNCRDREQQVRELTQVVTGIRLFNRDCHRGGEGIDDSEYIAQISQ
ncbi:hypothetical protein PR048_029822 [Dryococelus australis]|uniref:Cilia- and flagella-associated protein 206 n=1 Tax=Dryococelus australis TaxID=614101 RepID=A0ABQ9GB68_9NEOP|nr:hypothetical protein PR048_029822 [Dryococelus australis]